MRAGRVVSVKLKINRLLGLRAPTNEFTHRVAPNLKKKEIGLLARGLLAYYPHLWAGGCIACSSRGLHGGFGLHSNMAFRTVMPFLYVGELVAIKVEYEEANGR